MNNQDTNKESIIIEDLAAANAEEIKDGMFDQGRVRVSSSSGVNAALNHNETIEADHQAQEADTQELADLTIDGESASATKGGIGMLLPAVQKVREAAARSQS